MTATTKPLESPVETTDRLTVETAKLRSKRSLPIDRGFQAVGAALLGVGLLAIIAGWYGVSHTARGWRQTPYVMSGGLLGLALVFTGGFAYFASWMTRMVEQAHRQTAVLERIELALTGARGSADAAALVVVPPGILHRASCPLLLGKTDLRSPEDDEDLRSCPVCEPPI